jgi:branched-chain amino acid transport system substrate-binding protein
VKIGFMGGAAAGPFATMGRDMEDLVALMAEEANRAGGVNGARVDLRRSDGPPELVSAGVVAVVDASGSAEAEASQDIYDEAGIVQVSAGASSAGLAGKGLARFFRTCPRDGEQGRALARHVKGLGFRRAAIVHDGSPWSKGPADDAGRLLKAEGVDTVFFGAMAPGGGGAAAALAAMKAKAPDVIVFFGYSPEAALLLRQKREMGWGVAMIGGDATYTPALVKSAGLAAAAGYYLVSPPGPGDVKGGAAGKLLEAFRQKHGKPPSFRAMLAGDAFGVIVEAARSAGPDPARMAGWLHNTLKGYNGLTGTISFDGQGDRIGEVYRLYQVDDKGAFVMK